MKKNILAIQSLLLVPLISSSSLLSMDTPKQSSSKKATKHAPVDTKSSDKIDTSSDTYLTRKREHSQTFNQVVAELQGKNAQKKDKPEAIKISLSIEAPTTLDSEAKEITVDLPAPQRKKIPLAIAITETEVIANPKAEELTHKEVAALEAIAQEVQTDKQDQLSNTEISTELLESYAMPLPQTKGFSAYWIAKKMWQSNTVVVKEMLASESNEFDPNNEDHLKLLNTAINESISASNVNDIMLIINTCQEKYAGQLELDPITARKAHKLLADTIANERSTLKNALDNTNSQFIEKNMAALQEIQDTILKKATQLETCFMEYSANNKKLTAEQNNNIVALKKATTAIHLLNKRLKLAKNEYCSDNEDETFDTSALGKSVGCITPDKVAHKYTPEHTVKQIGMTSAMQITEQNSLQLITDVRALQASAQNIQLSSK